MNLDNLNPSAKEMLLRADKSSESILTNQGEETDRDYVIGCLAAAARLLVAHAKTQEDFMQGLKIHAIYFKVLALHYKGEKLHGATKSGSSC